MKVIGLMREDEKMSKLGLDGFDGKIPKKNSFVQRVLFDCGHECALNPYDFRKDTADGAQKCPACRVGDYE
jgi:hypothetical protein